MMRRGQKRRRQSLADQEANKQHMMDRTKERRDWSSLPDDVLESISDLLLSEDVTEYIRFRAVCSGWRRCTAPPSNTESLFRPHNWIIITSGQHDNFLRRRVKDPRCFFNVSNGKYLRVDIPQFRQGYTPVSVVDGLLVLLKNSTGELCLLNPFSLSLTELPNVDSLLSIVPSRKRDIRYDLSSVNFVSSTVVVFCFKVYRKVVYARIRGDRWIGMDEKVSCFSTVSFHGQLYASEWLTGDVIQFELEEAKNKPGMEPKLRTKTLIQSSGCCAYNGLLEFEGQMLLLRKQNHRFEVHKVDVENSKLIPTTVPHDHTFFASESRCLSVSTSVSPSLLPQSIYYYTVTAQYIVVYLSHHPNLESAHFYYPHHENICLRNGSSSDQNGPYSLPSHLICHCVNFYMPPGSLLASCHDIYRA